MEERQPSASDSPGISVDQGGARHAGQPDLVVDLQHVGKDDLDRAGGKGANLGELTRAGFPVPHGFVVTTAAYDRVIAHNRLDETISRALREASSGGSAIREAFRSMQIPLEIEREIVTAYARLPGTPAPVAVAVRSSATAEDLPDAAFAGQQDTFLNITGTDALLHAVRCCWASLWTDRAISYRTREGLDQQAVKLAVVVQQMVAAEAAGVLFTANPVTGARDEVVVDASPGLGEAVVSGLVTPDYFALRRRWLGAWRWRITEWRPGRREVIVQARQGGGTERVTGPTGALPAIPDRAISRLASLGTAIERHFGRPQDVEWAWAGGQLYIVQARPITALPEPAPRPGRLQQMMAGLFAELYSVRPYPFDVTTWEPALFGAIASIFEPFGLTAQPIRQIFDEEDGVVVRLSGRSPFRPTPGILLAPLRVLRLIRRFDPVHWQTDPLLTDALARARSLEARDPRALSWTGLLATVRAALAILLPLVGELRRRYFPRAALAAGLLILALGMLRRRDRLGTLLSGVENRTIETNRALEALAARIRSDATLAGAFERLEVDALWAGLNAQPPGRTFLTELRTFLDCYGHREAVIASVVQPTWKDAPEVALSILKGLARVGPRPELGRPEWEAARDDLLALPLFRLPPVRSAFLKRLAEARRLMQIRENTHFYATLSMPIIRRSALEMGQRLVAFGVLEVPEDVFHLKLDELERIDGTLAPPPRLAQELRAAVLRRKARRAALEGTPLVDPRLFRQGERSDVLVRGIPGSPGVANGPVRIIREGAEFDRLRSGEVLVAPYTNPAWTPLFQRAAAVVVDTGGVGSHAAIVAREYGIPAVMATADGTRRLVDGQRVRVDGGRGSVVRADAAGGEPG